MIDSPRIMAARRRSRESASMIILYVCAVFALAMLLFSAVNLLPRLAHLISLSREGDDFIELRQEIMSAATQKWKLERDRTDGDGAEAVALSPDNYNDLLIGLAKENGVQIRKLQERGRITLGEFSAKSVEVELSGTFNSLRGFTSALETQPIPFRIQALQAVSPDAVSNALTCEISVAVVLPDDAGIKR